MTRTEQKRSQRQRRYDEGCCTECGADRNGDKRTLCAACRGKWAAKDSARYQAKRDQVRASNAAWIAANRDRMRTIQREWARKKRRQAWIQADRIAEMRELSDLSLMGRLRWTELDVGSRAA